MSHRPNDFNRGRVAPGRVEPFGLLGTRQAESLHRAVSTLDNKVVSASGR